MPSPDNGINGYHWHYLDGYLDAEGEPPAVREALARLRLLSRGPVFAAPGELVVGALHKSTGNEPLANRTSAHYVQRRVLDAIGAAGAAGAMRKSSLEAGIARLSDTVVDLAFPAGYSEEERLASESGTAMCCHFNGHMALDYGRLLGRGIRGLREDVRRHARRVGAGQESRDRQDFYRAMEITLDAIAVFIRRHGEEADRRARSPLSGDSPQRLSLVRDICMRIAEEPPSGYLEALQLLWFGMMLGDYDSFGRFDQYLLPFYSESVETGATGREIQEAMTGLWAKIEEHGAIMSMTIGGVRPDGGSGINPLTLLALRTTRELGRKSPNLCLRISSDSPAALWEEAHRSLTTGQSLPALYNEALIIPLLEKAGVAAEDARDFCLAGCSQVVIPGKSSFGCDMGAYNALKCLELALHDGWDPRTRKRAGPPTGRARDLFTFQAVREAWSSQVRHAVRMGASICNKDSLFRRNFCSTIRSLLTADCLERGAGIFRGGARYYAIQSEIVGLTNTANALAGIRKVVFEDRDMGLEQLVAALDSDFQGHEQLRLKLGNTVQKFGNDDPAVDGLRASISSEFYAELSSYAAEPGGIHWPGEVIFSYHVDLASQVGASADGRRAGTPLSDSAGPAQGTDLRGPTALLNSMLALPQERCMTCCSLNLKFTPSLWTGAREEVLSLFRSYFARGGFQLQVNVVDARTLEEARRNPAAFRSLVVRVGGFSAYFTQLEPRLQEEIIQRTAHGAL
jgi:formate C-acetyltransferase